MILKSLHIISFGGLTNVNNALFRADAGSTLSLRELLDIAGVLRVIRNIISFGCIHKIFKMRFYNRHLRSVYNLHSASFMNYA